MKVQCEMEWDSADYLRFAGWAAGYVNFCESEWNTSKNLGVFKSKNEAQRALEAALGIVRVEG